MLLNTFALIFAIICVSCRAEDVCQVCKDNLASLKNIFSSSEADLEKLAKSLCFQESKCASSVGAYLKQAKETYSKKAADSETVCKPVCEQEDKINLGVKASMAIMSVLTKLLKLVEEKQKAWKTNFCNTCSEQLQPFTSFFSANEAELKGKIGRTCYALNKAGITTAGCHAFLENLLTKAQQPNFPLCPLLCKKLADQIEDTTNRDKLEEIATRETETKEEVNEKLAKVEEVIQDNEETMPYVLAGDVNAFCALCIRFTTKLPEFEKTIVKTLSEMIAEIMFDDATINEHKLVEKLETGIGKSFSTFVAKYKDPTMCQSQPIMACSLYTYNIVQEKLRQQDASQVECDSCQTFLSYVAPILHKPTAQKHLSDYLFKEIVNIFSADLLDNLSLNVHSLVTSGIENLAKLMNDNAACTKSKSCTA